MKTRALVEMLVTFDQTCHKALTIAFNNL